MLCKNHKGVPTVQPVREVKQRKTCRLSPCVLAPQYYGGNEKIKWIHIDDAYGRCWMSKTYPKSKSSLFSLVRKKPKLLVDKMALRAEHIDWMDGQRKKLFNDVKLQVFKQLKKKTVEMAYTGKVPEFDRTKEDFDSYLDGWQQMKLTKRRQQMYS